MIEAVENPHDRRLIARAQVGEVAAQELIEDTGVPRSTAYRRIERLRELGLLVVTGGAIREGHAIDRYKARVELVSVEVRKGEVHAHWQLLESPEERLHRLWGMLR